MTVEKSQKMMNPTTTQSRRGCPPPQKLKSSVAEGFRRLAVCSFFLAIFACVAPTTVDASNICVPVVRQWCDGKPEYNFHVSYFPLCVIFFMCTMIDAERERCREKERDDSSWEIGVIQVVRTISRSEDAVLIWKRIDNTSSGKVASL